MEQETHDRFAYDTLAGPVYAVCRIDDAEAARMAAWRDAPHIVKVLVWPWPEAGDRRPELRRYYALNLAQAIARAAEIQVRLREQDRAVVLVDLRAATDEETERFFRAMDVLEAGMQEMPPAGARQVPKQSPP